MWGDFDSWMEKRERPTTCKECDHKTFNEPEWDEQQVKIQRLINAEVRKIGLSTRLGDVKNKTKT